MSKTKRSKFIMESAVQKFKRNIKEGTFFKNVPIALRNRLIKYITTSNTIYFLNKERVEMKKYESNINKLSSNYIKVGNYYLDSRIPITKKSIVYSLGILADISFDLYLNNKFGCEIFMYDPTPVSIAFMDNYKSNKLLRYKPIGVWTENTSLRFYEPKLGGSFSVMQSEGSGKYFDAKCMTMESIMQENGHAEISIFKADIEGAALPVLNQMIENNICPDQIVVEFERPQNDKLKIKKFFKDVSELRSMLRASEYEEYLLPRIESKYYSLEMLFVRKNKIQ